MRPTESRFWAAYAALYDRIWDSPFTRRVNQVTLGDGPGIGTAVDLGCGTGLSSRELTRRGWRTIGVDTTPPMLARATTRGRITEAVLADAVATGLPAGQASVVIVSNLLHLHPSPEAVLAEALRLVTPGGRIVCVWPADTATWTTALKADVGSGRPWFAALLAAGLRVVIGLAGASVGARRWPSPVVAATIRRWGQDHALPLLRDGRIAALEEYAVFSCPVSAAESGASADARPAPVAGRDSLICERTS